MTRSVFASILVLLAISGCPEPVDADDPGGASAGPGAGGPDAGGGGGKAGPPAGGGTEGGPPAGGAGGAPDGGGGAIPDADLEPVQTQAELAGGATISGTLVCPDCTGKLLVRVLPPPPDQGGTDEGIVLITNASFDAAGPFEIKVPKERPSVVLQIVDDADNDGKPSAGERMGIPVDGPVTVQAEVKGVILEVGVFPQVPIVDASGAEVEVPAIPPNDGAGPEGPAPDGVPAGDAPAGEAPTEPVAPGGPPASGNR
jgi:hypothetical protein